MKQIIYPRLFIHPNLCHRYRPLRVSLFKSIHGFVPFQGRGLSRAPVLCRSLSIVICRTVLSGLPCRQNPFYPKPPVKILHFLQASPSGLLCKKDPSFILRGLSRGTAAAFLQARPLFISPECFYAPTAAAPARLRPGPPAHLKYCQTPGALHW